MSVLWFQILIYVHIFIGMSRKNKKLIDMIPYTTSQRSLNKRYELWCILFIYFNQNNIFNIQNSNESSKHDSYVYNFTADVEYKPESATTTSQE